MNEQQYRKQLLVQQIDAHRGLLRLEMQRVRDLNPVQPFIDLGQQALGVAGLIRSGSGGMASSVGAGLWNLNMKIIAPLVLRFAAGLLKRRKKGGK